MCITVNVSNTIVVLPVIKTISTSPFHYKKINTSCSYSLNSPNKQPSYSLFLSRWTKDTINHRQNQKQQARHQQRSHLQQPHHHQPHLQQAQEMKKRTHENESTSWLCKNTSVLLVHILRECNQPLLMCSLQIHNLTNVTSHETYLIQNSSWCHLNVGNGSKSLRRWMINIGGVLSSMDDILLLIFKRLSEGSTKGPLAVVLEADNCAELLEIVSFPRAP